MIIVVEGFDNTGKTTLSLELAKKLKAIFVKAERPRVGPDLMVYQSILEKAEEYSGVVVTDRHVAVSEPIYGNILRGSHGLDSKSIEHCLKRVNYFVYCRPPTKVILRSFNEREQLEGVLDNSYSILNAYDMYFESMLWDNLCYYNFTRNQVEDVIKWISDEEGAK